MRALLFAILLTVVSIPMILADDKPSDLNADKTLVPNSDKLQPYICGIQYTYVSTYDRMQMKWSWTLSDPSFFTFGKEGNYTLVLIFPQKDNKIYSVNCEKVTDTEIFYEKVCYIYTNIWIDLPQSQKCKHVF